MTYRGFIYASQQPMRGSCSHAPSSLPLGDSFGDVRISTNDDDDQDAVVMVWREDSNGLYSLLSL